MPALVRELAGGDTATAAEAMVVALRTAGRGQRTRAEVAAEAVQSGADSDLVRRCASDDVLRALVALAGTHERERERERERHPQRAKANAWTPGFRSALDPRPGSDDDDEGCDEEEGKNAAGPHHHPRRTRTKGAPRPALAALELHATKQEALRCSGFVQPPLPLSTSARRAAMWAFRTEETLLGLPQENPVTACLVQRTSQLLSDLRAALADAAAHAETRLQLEHACLPLSRDGMGLFKAATAWTSSANEDVAASLDALHDLHRRNAGASSRCAGSLLSAATEAFVSWFSEWLSNALSAHEPAPPPRIPLFLLSADEQRKLTHVLRFSPMARPPIASPLTVLNEALVAEALKAQLEHLRPLAQETSRAWFAHVLRRAPRPSTSPSLALASAVERTFDDAARTLARVSAASRATAWRFRVHAYFHAFEQGLCDALACRVWPRLDSAIAKAGTSPMELLAAFDAAAHATRLALFHDDARMRALLDAALDAALVSLEGGDDDLLLKRAVAVVDACEALGGDASAFVRSMGLSSSSSSSPS